MSKFKLAPNALQVLNAQVNLTGVFNHTLRADQDRRLPFRLTVDRNESDTAFTIDMGSQRHSITLEHGKATHLRLADFIEEIANGPMDPGSSTDSLPIFGNARRVAGFSDELRHQVFELVKRGGAVSLDVGLELPVHVAVHRNKTRTAVTTIMSIGVKRPRTKCFTVSGPDMEMYEKVTESLTHLITVATPAAEAA